MPGRPARPRWPGIRSRRRAARGSMTRTTPPRRPGRWGPEAPAAGASRVRAKMAQAVQLAALHGATATDRALGQAAAAGRFADGDLASVIAHQALAGPGETSRAGEDRTLAQGTGGWAPRGGQEENR